MFNMMVMKIVTISAEFLLLLYMTYVSSRKHMVLVHLRNEFDFCKVHGIMKTSVLLQASH